MPAQTQHLPLPFSNKGQAASKGQRGFWWPISFPLRGIGYQRRNTAQWAICILPAVKRSPPFELQAIAEQHHLQSRATAKGLNGLGNSVQDSRNKIWRRGRDSTIPHPISWPLYTSDAADELTRSNFVCLRLT